MICIIRIAGETGLDENIKETLSRLRLRKKYSCIVIENPNEIQLGMLKKISDFVAYGDINESAYKELIEKRGKKVNGPKGISSGVKLKPFFRLHPPRKGIDSKKHFGESSKGVLGNNKEKINDLVLRML